jgi:hypothetical protein
MTAIAKSHTAAIAMHVSIPMAMHALTVHAVSLIAAAHALMHTPIIRNTTGQTCRYTNRDNGLHDKRVGRDKHFIFLFQMCGFELSNVDQ